MVGMRKEILAALAVGIVFGLILTFGLYTLRRRIVRNITPQKIADSIKQNSPSPTPQSRLQIQAPLTDTLTDQETIQVVGRALPESSVIVLAPTGEYIMLADKDGDFALNVKLIAGGNRLTIDAISPEGQKDTAVLGVVYSTVDLNAPAATPAGGRP